MSPRTGRPTSDNPKKKLIQVRMDEETVQKLDSLVEKENSDRSKIIRQGIEIQYENKK